MNNDDLENMLHNFSEMVKNNDIPDNFKDIISNFSMSNNSSSNSNNSNETDNSFNLDADTMLKIKQIMSSLNSNKPDPRSNLLLSLKPYLKESRKKKIDQYIKLLNMEKAFETFSSLGGDKKDDV